VDGRVSPLPVKLRAPRVVALAVCVIASVLLYLLPSAVKRSVGDAVLSVGFRPVQRTVLWFSSIGELTEENEHLRRSVVRLSMENALLREYEMEALRLRGVLAFASSRPSELIPAELIGLDPGPDLRRIIVAAGERSGVMRDHAVVVPEGLVGRVVQVYSDASVVQLLSDPACRPSGLVRRSRALGIVRTVPGKGLTLDNVPFTDDVRTGDTVVTAGLGGVFPAGIPVGVVSDVRGDPSKVFLDVRLDPFVRTFMFEEVFVVRTFPPEPDTLGFFEPDTSEAEAG
jgi:rod shape-determining protein MreC